MAVRVHTGPMEELATAWPEFVGEVMSSGHMISGPPIQIFGSDNSLEMRLPDPVALFAPGGCLRTPPRSG